MTQDVSYQFTGKYVVREIALDRTDEVLRLFLSLSATEGHARLVFVNAFPMHEFFGILEADEVWVSECAPDGEAGRIKVQYWQDGLHQFTADHVIDLDEQEYDFASSPGPEDIPFRTGPVEFPPGAEEIGYQTGPIDTPIDDDDSRYQTGPIDTSSVNRED